MKLTTEIIEAIKLKLQYCALEFEGVFDFKATLKDKLTFSILEINPISNGLAGRFTKYNDILDYYKNNNYRSNSKYKYAIEVNIYFKSKEFYINTGVRIKDVKTEFIEISEVYVKKVNIELKEFGLNYYIQNPKSFNKIKTSEKTFIFTNSNNIYNSFYEVNYLISIDNYQIQSVDVKTKKVK